jgi:excinuclease UvrABC nuclease subunit
LIAGCYTIGARNSHAAKRKRMSDQPNRLKKYHYVRICVNNASGKYSTISLSTTKKRQYEHLLQLARGSSAFPAARVGEVCRQAAAELCKAKFKGKLSPAVYDKALRKLRGAFDGQTAEAYDRLQFPDGVPVTDQK